MFFSEPEEESISLIQTLLKVIVIELPVDGLDDLSRIGFRIQNNRMWSHNSLTKSCLLVLGTRVTSAAKTFGLVEQDNPNETQGGKVFPGLDAGLWSAGG
jgi:hypothetical protein